MADSQLIKSLKGAFESVAPDAICVYLFGSRARGDARAQSDIDVGVLMNADSVRLDPLGLRLGGDLERVLGRGVDLVVLNQASSDLVHRVLRDGILVVDRDRTTRIRFEVAARNAYFDMKPHFDHYRRSVASGSRG